MSALARHRLDTDVAYTSGENVVHPRHGIATIEGIATRDVGGASTRYVELSFASPSLRVFVPLESVDEVGVRQLCTKEQVAAILTLLAQPSDVPESWAERAASTTSRMRSRELGSSSMVIRDLTRHARRSGKPLSRAENFSLETCLDAVSSELSLVLDISKDDARALVLGKIQQ